MAVYCGACGSGNAAGAATCASCGRELRAYAPKSRMAAPAPPRPAAARAPAPAAPPAPPRPRRLTLVFALLLLVGAGQAVVGLVKMADVDDRGVARDESGSFYVGIGALTIVGAFAAWRRVAWGRRLLVGVLGLDVVVILVTSFEDPVLLVFRLAIYLSFLMYFLNGAVKAWYASAGAPSAATLPPRAPLPPLR